MNYRRDIDGLRALAVAAVIVNHLNKDVMPSGFLGVDIFFVISGYVITASLQDRLHEGLREFVRVFYVRRIKRLLPALLLTLAVGGVLISLFDPSPGSSLRTGAAAVFGLSNLYLVRQSADYFSDSTLLNVFTHTWSLGVEEQFYLIFPPLVWLLARSGGNRARAGTVVVGAVLAVLSLATLAYFVHMTRTQPHAAYFLMPTRFWQLAAGALVLLLTHAGERPLASGVAARLATPALLAVLAATLWAPASNLMVTTIVVTGATALLLAIQPVGWGARLLTSRPMVLLGLISYSLYLWHWVVICIARWTVGVDAPMVPLLLALMLGLAVATWRWVEKPLRHADWGRGGALLRGGMAAACVFGALVVLAKPLAGRLYAGVRPPLVASGVQTLTDPYRIEGTRWRWAGERCVFQRNDQVGTLLQAPECTLGDPGTAGRRMLIVGNSFTAAFAQAFDELVTRDGWAVTLTSSWGASPAPGIRNRTPWNEANDWYWSRVVPDLLARLQPGDWVFVAGDLAELAPRQPDAAQREELAVFERAVGRWADELRARGLRLAMLHANPFARDANCEPAAAAPQWFTRRDGPCTFFSREASLQRRRPLDDALQRLQRDHGLVVVDLFDLFCPGRICRYEGADGRQLYRDVYSHPSVEGARLAAPKMREALLAPVQESSAR